jgi:hypothetical protein
VSKYVVHTGKLTETMPLLRERSVLYKPAPVEFCLRIQAAYPNTSGSKQIYTGDAIATSSSGDAVLQVHSPLLSGLNPRSNLEYGGLELSVALWNALKTSPSNLYLRPSEVQEVDGKGYVYKEGIWQPENPVVERVWHYLTRGRGLQPHLKLAKQTSGNNRVLILYLNNSQLGDPVLRSLVIQSLTHRSNVSGTYNLDDDNACIIGVRSLRKERYSPLRIAGHSHEDVIQ